MGGSFVTDKPATKTTESQKNALLGVMALGCFVFCFFEVGWAMKKDPENMQAQNGFSKTQLDAVKVSMLPRLLFNSPKELNL